MFFQGPAAKNCSRKDPSLTWLSGKSTPGSSGEWAKQLSLSFLVITEEFFTFLFSYFGALFFEADSDCKSIWYILSGLLSAQKFWLPARTILVPCESVFSSTLVCSFWQTFASVNGLCFFQPTVGFKTFSAKAEIRPLLWIWTYNATEMPGPKYFLEPRASNHFLNKTEAPEEVPYTRRESI